MTNILTINAGSSSIRFALFECAGRPLRVLDGKMERIGSPDVCLTVHANGGTATQIDMNASRRRGAVDSLVEWLQGSALPAPDAVGHRVVHGMLHTAPERVTAELLAELRRITPYDPEHMPREIELIEALQRAYSKVPHVACFDTAFHRSMPGVATQLPIPRRYAQRGVQRYGFHGLSYTFLMQELTRIAGVAAGCGRVILAHLGSGASLAAVQGGRCID
ncbi:MAG TPA: acetate kinase, partial [Steroidobacteraceae bacterium]|nr:acetate kinase [Steroidobacteraceae bacterium]